MTAPLIDHIAILVPDLEEAIARWTAATGYEFSPIVRYRATHFVDDSDPEPHLSDTRLSLTREGPPRVELMEATGTGVHGPAQLGVHHIGFAPASIDIPSKVEQLAVLGIGQDGAALTSDGETLLWFSDKIGLGGIRLAFVSHIPGPVVADDGSPLWRNPETGRSSPWGPPEGVTS